MEKLASMLRGFKPPENVEFYDKSADEKREEQRRKFNAIKRSGIPPIFRDADLHLCNGQVMRWVQGVKNGGRSSLLMQGDVGRGKTYSACAAMIELLPSPNCRFTTFDEILRNIRASYEGQETERAIVERLVNVSVLCIDDFGKTKPTEWNLPVLFEIIDRRWNSGKPIIVTTQYTGEKLLQRLAVNGDMEYAKAIMSRLLDNSVTMRFDGPDRRIQ